MGNDRDNANPNSGKDSVVASPSSIAEASHFFNNLVSRTMLRNQGTSLISRISDKPYNLSLMKPALTPDMIPFTSMSGTDSTQNAASNKLKERHDTVGEKTVGNASSLSSNWLNAFYSKPKTDRQKSNSTTLSNPTNNPVNLHGENKGMNNYYQDYSGEVSPTLHKETADKRAVNMDDTSPSHMRNTNKIPTKLSIVNKGIVNKGTPVEQGQFGIGPAKLTNISSSGRVDKNSRPVDVTIHIGRVEVKSVQQFESQRSSPATPAAHQMSFSVGPTSTARHMTLNDYLRKRAEGEY
jgi:hypothetical protein